MTWREWFVVQMVDAFPRLADQHSCLVGSKIQSIGYEVAINAEIYVSLSSWSRIKSQEVGRVV